MVVNAHEIIYGVSLFGGPIGLWDFGSMLLRDFRLTAMRFREWFRWWDGEHCGWDFEKEDPARL